VVPGVTGMVLDVRRGAVPALAAAGGSPDPAR